MVSLKSFSVVSSMLLASACNFNQPKPSPELLDLNATQSFNHSSMSLKLSDVQARNVSAQCVKDLPERMAARLLEYYKYSKGMDLEDLDPIVVGLEEWPKSSVVRQQYFYEFTLKRFEKLFDCADSELIQRAHQAERYPSLKTFPFLLYVLKNDPEWIDDRFSQEYLKQVILPRMENAQIDLSNEEREFITNESFDRLRDLKFFVVEIELLIGFGENYNSIRNRASSLEESQYKFYERLYDEIMSRRGEAGPEKQVPGEMPVISGEDIEYI